MKKIKKSLLALFVSGMSVISSTGTTLAAAQSDDIFAGLSSGSASLSSTVSQIKSTTSVIVNQICPVLLVIAVIIAGIAKAYGMQTGNKKLVDVIVGGCVVVFAVSLIGMLYGMNKSY